MSIKEDVEVAMYLPVVGFKGTELGECFSNLIREYGLNIRFICSIAYNLGMIHGKRAERARRKEKHD